MKFTIKAILLGLGFVAILAAILFFGVKWSYSNVAREEVMRMKPWQPMARLALTAVVFSLTCIFGGALVKVTGRHL